MATSQLHALVPLKNFPTDALIQMEVSFTQKKLPCPYENEIPGLS